MLNFFLNMVTKILNKDKPSTCEIIVNSTTTGGKQLAEYKMSQNQG